MSNKLNRQFFSSTGINCYLHTPSPLIIPPSNRICVGFTALDGKHFHIVNPVPLIQNFAYKRRCCGLHRPKIAAWISRLPKEDIEAVLDDSNEIYDMLIKYGYYSELLLLSIKSKETVHLNPISALQKYDMYTHSHIGNRS
eukprot:114156_1